MGANNPTRTMILSVLMALAIGSVGCMSSSTSTPSPAARTHQASDSTEQFEAVLEAAELEKFQSLPVQFQDALREESKATSASTARQYLKDLPEVVSPIAQTLSPEALNKFSELSARRQRMILLGYDEAFKVRSGQDTAKTPPPSAILEAMVDLAHKMEFGDGRTFLPPMPETLSKEALAKLESVDSRMRQAFELIWNNRVVGLKDVDGVAQKLEEALIAAPNQLPEITEIGLSTHSTELIEEVPAAKRLIEEWMAAEIVQSVGWRSNFVSSIDRFLVQFRSPEARNALARLYIPSESGVRPIVCELGPSFGVWPEWSLPLAFRKVPPSSLMAEWPSHREVLSSEALTKLDSLDSGLREKLEEDWYGSGPLPMEARKMACLALEWEASLHLGSFGNS